MATDAVDLPSWRQRLLSRLRGTATALPPVVPVVLERLGTHTLSDKVDTARSGGDIVAIGVPPRSGQIRTRRVKMYRHDGTDQCAQAMLDGGWYGFERPLPDVVVRTLGAGPEGCFFDVGANTGLYSLIAAAVRPQSKVYAFEAYPPVLEALHRNLALNAWKKHIEVVACAVADGVGTTDLFVPRSVGLIETSCSLDGSFKEDVVERVQVSMTTLDEYWSGLGRPRVRAVKIDVEGTEHRVLAGAHKLVDGARPVLFYEFLSRGEQQALQQFASDHRLVDVRLREREAVIGPEIAYEEQAWNHAMVPEEAMAGFEEILAAAKLPLRVIG